MERFPRHPAAVCALLVTLGSITSCSSSRPRLRSDLPAAPPATAAPREQTADQQVQHVLNRLAFGARPGDVQAVRAIGVDAWIELQLQPARIGDSAVDRLLAQLPTLRMSSEQLVAKYPPPGVQRQRLAARGTISAEDSARLRELQRQSQVVLGEVAAAKIARAVSSERQLLEVMVDFWENHFSVFAGKDRTRYFIAEYSERVIRPNALGNFRELLGAVARSPAMLYYLDNWQSAADSNRSILQPSRQAINRRPGLQQRRRGLNENYARELMELHTLGVDGGYTQQDVVEVARALTGWTILNGPNGGGFVFRPAMHDAEQKVVLGHRLRAGRGVEDGDEVLDILARHPSTARFIATKLSRRLVADEPPESLVDRAAATFLRTNGDIREVVRTIVTSPEFFSAGAFRSKVKSPFEVVTSTLRVMGAPTEVSPRLVQLVAQLGQPLYGHQAPNGYPETGDAWMNTGAILNRINFGIAAASGRVPGIRIGAWPVAQSLANQPREAQVDGVIAELFGGYASPDTRAVLLSGSNPLLQNRAATDSGGRGMATATPGNARATSGFAQVVGLALGAPEFQRR